MQMLAMFVNENRNDWDDHLLYVMMAYRSSCHESTKCSPNLLMFGREITFPVNVMFGDCPDRTQVCPSEFVEWLRHSMALSFEVAYENLKVAASRQKKAYEKGLKPRSFDSGELVWRWYPPLANVKLGLGWTGPYKVLSKITSVTYKIEKLSSLKQIVVHVDHLKKYYGEESDDSLESNAHDSSNMDNDVNIIEPSVTTQVFEEVISCSTPVEVTPYQTRVGRKVKPKIIFSPE